MKGQQLIDITGQTFGFLKVLGFSHIGNRRRSYWKCECTRCGKIVTLRKDAFAYESSKIKSCGCWHRAESRERATRYRDKTTGKFIKTNDEKYN
jgi:hypothetical protein